MKKWAKRNAWEQGMLVVVDGSEGASVLEGDWGKGARWGRGGPHCEELGGRGDISGREGKSAPERAREPLRVVIPAPDDKTRAGGMHLRRLDQGKGTKKGNGKVTKAEAEAMMMKQKPTLWSSVSCEPYSQVPGL